ncbi:MAG: PQQ-like beta-propeller repeat protein [Deltaproteobacteria bacterium]|nr:PQQ-like beta-propeller repeat protein [Deltaproteobacteria bacterium]
MSTVTAVVALALALTSQYPEAVWPGYRHDSRNTGRSAFKGPGNPAEKWSIEGEWSEYLAVDRHGKLIIHRSTAVFAYDRNGNVAWKFANDADGPTIRADNQWYADDGDFLFLVSDSGQLVWKRAVDAGSYSFAGPSVGKDDSAILVLWPGIGFPDHYYVVSVNGTGATNWKDRFEAKMGGVAVGLDGTVYFPKIDGSSLFALHPDTGKIKWTYEHSATNFWYPPVVGDDGSVFLSTSQGIHVVTPEGKLKNVLMEGFNTSVASLGADGTIVSYVSKDDADVVAVYPDGTVKWGIKLLEGDSGFSGAPVVDAEGTVYLSENTGKGSTAGYLWAVSSDGNLKWTRVFGGPGGTPNTERRVGPAVIGDCNMLYFLFDYYKLYALGEAGDGGPVDCGFPEFDGGPEDSIDGGADGGNDAVSDNRTNDAEDAGVPADGNGADWDLADIGAAADAQADIISAPGCGCAQVGA